MDSNKLNPSAVELALCPFCRLHPTENDKGSFKKSVLSSMFELRHWCGDKARTIQISGQTAEAVATVWNTRVDPLSLTPARARIQALHEAATICRLKADSLRWAAEDGISPAYAEDIELCHDLEYRIRARMGKNPLSLEEGETNKDLGNAAQNPASQTGQVDKDNSARVDLGMTNGVELIRAERSRQVESEGWSHDHDLGHDGGELSIAAACYAVEGTDASVQHPNDDPDLVVGCSGWPWSERDWKPKDRIRNLVRAGALIAAEIDREIETDSTTQATASASAPSQTAPGDGQASPAESGSSSFEVEKIAREIEEIQQRNGARRAETESDAQAIADIVTLLAALESGEGFKMGLEAAAKVCEKRRLELMVKVQSAAEKCDSNLIYLDGKECAAAECVGIIRALIPANQEGNQDENKS